MVEILTHPAAVLAQTAASADAALSPGMQLLTHPAIFFLSVIGLGALIAIVAIIAAHWSEVRRAEADAVLKQDMLQRGMTADEIERVLRASQAPAAPKTVVEATPSGVATLMAKEGYDGDNMAAVLATLEERGRHLTADEFTAVRAMIKEGYDGDQIVVMVRALPRPAAAVPESGYPANIG